MISKWLVVSPALVLILGLCSCKNSENGSIIDSYRVPQPTWESGEAKEGFTSERTPTLPGQHAMNDVLNLNATIPRLIVETNCRNLSVPGSDSSEAHTLTNVSKISLFSVLPFKVLAPTSKEISAKTLCSLDLKAMNAIGSAHHFRSREFAIMDDSETTFQIDWHKEIGRKFSAENLIDARLYTLNNEPIIPSMICENGKEIGFLRGPKNDFSLSDFDPGEFFVGVDTKKCRIIGLQYGIVTMISKSFEVVSDLPACPGSQTFEGVKNFVFYKDSKPICRIKFPKGVVINNGSGFGLGGMRR